MANGQHDMEWRRTDLLDRQARIVQRRVNQTHVEVPSSQCVFRFGRSHLTHLQPDVGQPLTEQRSNLRKDDIQCRRRHPQPQPPDLTAIGAQCQRGSVIHLPE